MKHILIALATLTLLASCSFDPIQQGAPAKQMTPDAMMQKETMPKDTMMKDDKMMATGAMMQKEAPKMDRAMQSHGYMDYSPELVASALKDGQRVVLFFAASWCPSCKALDRAITVDLGSIGSDTLIVRVDYDNSTELKRKYGVVTQHTTVVLNTDGSLASKKLGARTVAEVVGK